ncbi:MAG: ATP-dependent helicase [Endomicrobia bacterium]|nr:ATP-dependent helicase [Endomicrobiia bacterium]
MFKNELDKEQLSAVEHIHNPLFVLAGAGSGKTRVITYRTINLMLKGINPNNILVVTFTRKASEEMKSRIKYKLNSMNLNYQIPMISTFHSFCYKFLKDNNIKSGYLISDDYERDSLVSKVLANMCIASSMRGTVKELLSKYKNTIDDNILNCKVNNVPFYEIFYNYQHALDKQKMIDFDDLLIYTAHALKSNEKLADSYSNLYKFILVDEYQDTNYLQLLILESLLKNHNNICVVGDINQSIYSFRGACENSFFMLEKFLVEEKGTQVRKISLKNNYRSQKIIIESANKVIANNHNLYGTQMNTVNNNFIFKIKKIVTENEEQEAQRVAEEINTKLKQDNNLKIAILYRKNLTSYIFEHELQKRNIQYIVLGKISFFKREEIRDLLAYLRLYFNRYNDAAFYRIINKPTRSIGKATVDKIEVVANKYNLSCFESFLYLLEKNEIKINNEISLFLKIFDKKNFQYVSDFLSFVIDTTKYDEFIKNKYDNAPMRIYNIQQLINYTSNLPFQATQVNNYLDNINLMQDDNEDKVNVILSTIHSSKGKEFDIVFIVNAHDKEIPLLHDIESIKEERRLFYVAMTRAKRELFLSYYVKSKCEIMFEESRFIKEIPNENIIEI